MNIHGSGTIHSNSTPGGHCRQDIIWGEKPLDVTQPSGVYTLQRLRENLHLMFTIFCYCSQLREIFSVLVTWSLEGWEKGDCNWKNLREKSHPGHPPIPACKAGAGWWEMEVLFFLLSRHTHSSSRNNTSFLAFVPREVPCFSCSAPCLVVDKTIWMPQRGILSLLTPN